jgi:hypothetical protein
LVRLKTGTSRYGPEVIKVARLIWEEYGCRCGKLLAPQIRLIIPFLERDEIFGPLITPEIKAKLLTISGTTINHPAWQWCQEKGVVFTRGRPCRKNGNCFVEQKNGGIIRKAAGYYRYDTDEETAALAGVYRLRCPLINSWYPPIKITGKERRENQAAARFLRIHEQKQGEGLPPLSDAHG